MAAMLQELDWRKGYLGTKRVDSIYFGGGTPSLLNEAELMAFLSAVEQHFEVSPDAEITLEANPDDLSAERLAALARSPVNRLSIGIQSFAEEDLRFFNRAHNAREAERCLDLAHSAGFEDLTVDLIYGAPSTSDAQWADNLRKVFAYRIPHLSCYALTVEPQTALGHFVKNGKVPPVEEEHAARQFELLLEATQAAGYEQYEISNFALPGRYARHNSSYWKGEPYLGIGPSAHSFRPGSRQWNIAHNAKYLRIMQCPPEEREALYEREELQPADQYNEYVMTGLRTKWGVSLARIREIGSSYEAHFLREAQSYLAREQLLQKEETYYLAPSARFLADGIAAGLFW